MTTNSKMQNPGDVIIEKLTLKSYNGFEMDILGLFDTITIFEDIYSNCMSGHITIIDSLNLSKNFPIVGDEILTLTYRTPFFDDGVSDQKSVSYTFKTYKVSVHFPETARDTTSYMRLEFMSEYGIRSMQKRISKSYVKMPVSKMVDSIYKEYFLEGTEIEVPLKTFIPTFDKRTYTIPYWNPFYAINWLCHRSRYDRNTNMCDYVFFENADGFHFTPISLLKQKFRTYSYSNETPGYRDQNGERMLWKEMRNFISVSVQHPIDNVKMQALGMFSSSVLTFDATSKKWKRNFYEYTDNFSQTPHLNTNPLVVAGKNSYSKVTESHYRFYPDSSFVYKDAQSANDPDEIVLLRQSLLNQANSLSILAEAYGDSSVRVGQVIRYNAIAKGYNEKTQNADNDYLKGNYLVTAIRHDITSLEHKMLLTLSRDSYSEPLANKKNTELSVETNR